MKYAREFVTNTVVGGLLVVLPVYLAVLLLLKGMQAVIGLVRPVAALLPAWVPAEDILALLIVLIVCAGVGLAVRTGRGRTERERIEKAFFGRLPGYSLFRSLTQQLAGRTEGTAWNKGGSLAWQLYDAAGRSSGPAGARPGVPTWSVGAVAPRSGGGFVVFY